MTDCHSGLRVVRPETFGPIPVENGAPEGMLAIGASLHAVSGVAGRLAVLADHRACGALEITGDPGGTIYLQDGYLAFAESPAAPDLGSRLVNSRRVLVDQWRRADQDSQPDGCAGDVLLRRGLIDAAEWQALIRSAALDALLALALAGGSGVPPAAPAARASFIHGQARCAGSVLRMDAAAAWAHARQEAERLAGRGVLPDARPQWCGPGRDRLVFSRPATAVLRQFDGRATVRELAWRNGLALYGVMDWVVHLIHDGVCVITPQDADIRWSPPDPDVLRDALAALRQLA